jgi:hypothetical protein
MEEPAPYIPACLVRLMVMTLTERYKCYQLFQDPAWLFHPETGLTELVKVQWEEPLRPYKERIIRFGGFI